MIRFDSIPGRLRQLMILGTMLFASNMYSQVRVWEEPLTLPTYEIKAPDKNPMFFSNDSYQGASRYVYPYKLQDNLSNQKVDKTYQALYLENEYIKLCVLPGIGGRLFYATDKTNGYEMFYRQHVIKPANIGMLGAWISGGIEFCVFHHHRASTNIPVEYRLTENDDGSATIWIGETEPRHRMKWTLGITLHPGKSLVEVDGRLINPTENTNSILYWANVATHVNKDYQVIFPPSTEFAVYHAKNSFVHWPKTSNTYNGKEHYENNIDASWWKNHPDPISMFAHDIKDGFIAGYDHGKQAGTMHVANHHIVKGAKLWEWGPGAYGTMWDSEVLTDEDGPYAEIMTGAYSDNQPDYSWLKPYELKTFQQFWYPMRGTQGAVAANVNGTLNLKELSDGYFIAANSTTALADAKIELRSEDEIIYAEKISVSPSQPFAKNIARIHAQPQTLRLVLLDAQGTELISYQPTIKSIDPPLPDPVVPPKSPSEIESLEELYFTGLRIRQFHNARVDPRAYFAEILERDPHDVRANTIMGVICKEEFRLDDAAKYFRQSIKRSTANYTRPRDCEALFYLGVILQSQGHKESAYDTLYRAAWDQNFASPAYYHLAQISISNGHLKRALEEVDRSLDYNSSNLSARNLKATVLRRLEQESEAQVQLAYVLQKDPLNAWALQERIWWEDIAEATLENILAGNPESYLELAIGYLNSGFNQEAKAILDKATQHSNDNVQSYPTLYYYLGYILDQLGDGKKAKEYFGQAASLPSDYCFPYRHESQKIFHSALLYNPGDANAHYYLGNLLYDKQPSIAIQHWEESIKLSRTNARAFRNLGWGLYQSEQNISESIAAYENAVKQDPTDPKFYYELDRLYEIQGIPIQRRYEMLSGNHDVVSQRPDAFLQEIKVLVLQGESALAVNYLSDNFFPRQEGVDNLHDTYVDACLAEGIRLLRSGNAAKALNYFERADQYPENHQIAPNGEDERNAQILYYRGVALESLGEPKQAKSVLEQVARYDIGEPINKFYLASSYQKLGERTKAEELASEIKESAEKLLQPGVVDFFSKFGSEQSESKRMAESNFLLGLSAIIMGDSAKAAIKLKRAAQLDPSNLWVKILSEDM